MVGGGGGGGWESHVCLCVERWHVVCVQQQKQLFSEKPTHQCSMYTPCGHGHVQCTTSTTSLSHSKWMGKRGEGWGVREGHTFSWFPINASTSAPCILYWSNDELSLAATLFLETICKQHLPPPLQSHPPSPSSPQVALPTMQRNLI